MESKIELTERLRAEGRWSEASKFKDARSGIPRRRHESGTRRRNAAWEAMATAFPPVADGPADPPAGTSEAAADDDLIDVDALLADRKPPDLTRDVLWVYDHLADRNAKPQDAPTAGAWSLLLWPRRYKNRYFEMILPKAMANRPPGEEDHVREAEMRAEEIEAVLRKFDRSPPK